MAFVVPRYTKGEINRAGEILAAVDPPFDDAWIHASLVLANWRGAHAYPINTFQSTLRSKLKQIDVDALVAQRLKRTPSIIAKLQRFDGMQLARMQDIGGLRAVVASMSELRALLRAYESAHFFHAQMPTKDYIANPKPDGYRSVHLIYRYRNDRAPRYNGLGIELQIRTKMQHAWATAVETMGTYLGQALKSGQGDVEWRSFFLTASACLAIIEKTPMVPGFEALDREKIYARLARQERQLNVLQKLRGFAIATDKIHAERGTGSYHLIVLNSQSRTVRVTPYPTSRLDDATSAYTEIEQRAKAGEPIEAVLVSAGPIDALKKAYPNYFLDTEVFIRQVQRIINVSRSQKKNAK
ncbi:(p)ppGpp synthetase [Granulicella sp. 5B5]|uniref:RelA/SpoT domain-containing protein n=1 Tax=Granulicella sp. 5B5 TaxID=1617967 RepID=UPI0015F3E0FB|nr:RelA/SpoT domain-containing protein [Granulicella sp. 5B5]QMV19215.1 (p)ppGpp synthetase [Granulicella sp. 5B5]